MTFPPERPLPAALVEALVAARLEELGLGAAPAKVRKKTARASRR